MFNKLILLLIFSTLANAEPRREHFANCNIWGYLDGPRKEAMATRNLRIAVDSDSNVWYLNSYIYGNLRCITKEGRVITITGNDYWLSDNRITEGPASAMNALGVRSYSYGLPDGFFVVYGAPLKGEAYGCIYSKTEKGEIVKIWKNSAQHGRWWFKRVVGGGAAAWPLLRGQKIAGTAARAISNIQVGVNDELIVFAGKGFFRFDTATKELTCIAGFDDYKDKIPKTTSGNYPSPTEAFVDAESAFYVSYYYSDSPSEGVSIWRISPALDTAVKIAGAYGCCGPHMRPHRHNAKILPAGIILPSDHDKNTLRRAENGVYTHLCFDGEWRVSTTTAVPWAHFDFSVGPDGTGYSAYLGADFWGDFRMYKITGIDYGKPSVP